MAFENIHNYPCPQCGSTDCKYNETSIEKILLCNKCKKAFVLERKQPQLQPQRDLIKCPKCGSTAITTGPRGVNGFWGFIGASKTVNRCGSCGKTWEPK